MALLAGGCTATPINLPLDEMGAPASDSGFFQDGAASKVDSGSLPLEGGTHVPDASATDGTVGDGFNDGLTDGLTDGINDALGEAGALDGAGEAGSATSDALTGE